jgi:TetR/AcrR family transcriptional regulator, transcriptional repressor for nem operon
MLYTDSNQTDWFELNKEAKMSKGEQTREMILARAAQLFSRQGYFGSSLSDIMHETGLEKGGIYNHFTSKEQLALEAFDYSVELVRQRTRLAFAGKTNAVDRLLAIITVFQGLVEDPPLIGGCPILSTAVEADDAHPVLRERAREAMDSWRTTIHRIVKKGIERQEIRPEVEADTLATLLIATLEGAIMMSKLYGDNVHMRRVVDYLTNYINTTVGV